MSTSTAAVQNPRQWTTSPLGEFITLQRGYDLPYRVRRSGDVPIVTSSGITGSHRHAQVTGPGVVTGRYGTIGEVFYIPRDFWPLNTTLFVKDFKGNDPLFVSYLLRTIDFASHSGKSGVPGINRNDIHKLSVTVPHVSEQRAIAAALSDVDALIGVLDKLIAKKRAMKLATMQQLLTGKTRLPGWRNNRLRMSEIGCLPADWEVRRLGELFEITSSKRVFQRQWRDAGVPFYRARELAVLGEAGSIDNELFITQKLYEQFKNSYGVPRIGDMLVTGVGTLGKTYVVSDNGEFYFKDGNIIWFRCSGKLSADFLKQLYETPVITRQILEGASGTTVGTYTIQNAENTLIPLPSFAEQNAIAIAIRDMDAEITALACRRDKTRAIRQGMMQALLTGRVRLVKPQAVSA